MYTVVGNYLTLSKRSDIEDSPVTTNDLALLLAETRCEHGRLTLEGAERAGTGDDWTVYLRDAAHPCPYEVRDFYAYL
jgi:hypothetical protein